MFKLLFAILISFSTTFAMTLNLEEGEQSLNLLQIDKEIKQKIDSIIETENKYNIRLEKNPEFH